MRSESVEKIFLEGLRFIHWRLDLWIVFAVTKKNGKRNNSIYINHNLIWKQCRWKWKWLSRKIEWKTIVAGLDLISFCRTYKMHPIGYSIRGTFKCNRYSELQSGRILISVEYVSSNLAKISWYLELRLVIEPRRMNGIAISKSFPKEREKNGKKFENLFISWNYLINLLFASVKCFIYTWLFCWIQFTTCSEN